MPDERRIPLRGVAQDVAGKSISYPAVEVLDSERRWLVPLYDANGRKLPNPFCGKRDGSWECWVYCRGDCAFTVRAPNFEPVLLPAIVVGREPKGTRVTGNRIADMHARALLHPDGPLLALYAAARLSIPAGIAIYMTPGSISFADRRAGTGWARAISLAALEALVSRFRRLARCSGVSFVDGVRNWIGAQFEPNC